MAIYRKGQASMDADGYITGYGTNWKTALTLIRPGATIVFASNPVAYATISEIVNDTSLRATSTGGAVVPQSDYVILLHDSITVDGLAQDVAETLRYYQGQETMYQGFVEFLKNFEWQKLEAIDAKVKENAAAAASSEANAAASAAASDASKNESQAAAVISTNASNSASASKDAAAQSAASAKSEADRAAELATQLDANSLMRKDANLSDVADRRSAVNNLGLGWIDTAFNNSLVSSPDLSHRLVLGSDGLFVWQTNDGQTVPIAVTSGGTGATTADGARVNLQLDRFAQSSEQTHMYAQNKKMKIYVDDSGDWGAYDEASGAIKPLPVNRGGTGAMDVAGARNNFGLGEAQAVTFAQITSKTNNGVNGGIFESDNYNSDGVLISRGRMYSEIQNGVGKFTVSVSANNKTKYLQYDEDANLSGIGNLRASRVETGSVGCTGSIWAGQGNSIGMNTSDGGNKNIFLQNSAGDGNVGSWINLLQGNWHNGFWQLGAIRGAGADDISTVRLGVNNQGTDWKWFDFNNSYGGHLTANRGFKGQCVQGTWSVDNQYMGAPFYADTVTANDGGYSPVVAGGTRSTGGWDIRYSLGAISGGTNSWPRTVIHMLGNATYHRAYEFYHSGQIITWDSQPGIWGGSFEFQRVATSDRDLKKDIEYNDGKASFDNIMKFKPSTFVYKSDKYNRLRRGVIAQDLYEIDPEYVRIIPGAPIIDDSADNSDPDNPAIIDYRDDTLGLDNNVIMIDTALATRYIGGIVEKQQVEIESLKAEIEELKAMISKLIEK